MESFCLLGFVWWCLGNHVLDFSTCKACTLLSWFISLTFSLDLIFSETAELFSKSAELCSVLNLQWNGNLHNRRLNPVERAWIYFGYNLSIVSRSIKLQLLLNSSRFGSKDFLFPFQLGLPFSVPLPKDNLRRTSQRNTYLPFFYELVILTKPSHVSSPQNKSHMLSRKASAPRRTSLSQSNPNKVVPISSANNSEQPFPRVCQAFYMRFLKEEMNVIYLVSTRQIATN